MEHGAQKRPDAWRGACTRCGWRGEYRDRKWWAAADLAGHEVDVHGGAVRLPT